MNRFFDGDPLLPGEAVVLSGGNIVQVDGVFRNTGNEDVNGIDFGASHYFDSGIGAFDFGINATFLDSYEIQQSPASQSFEYAGWLTDVSFNNSNGDPSTGLGGDACLRWKGQLFASWSHEGFRLSLTGNCTDGYKDFKYEWDSGNPTDPGGFRTVEPWWTWDLSVSYDFGEKSESWLGDTRLTFGVPNLLDEDPPFVSSWGNNEIGYAWVHAYS